jgi:hypothetical protein
MRACMACAHFLPVSLSLLLFFLYSLLSLCLSFDRGDDYGLRVGLVLVSLSFDQLMLIPSEFS